ncbi:MAG: DUF4136 domain-containing protein [Ferruginibacter sp.]
MKSIKSLITFAFFGLLLSGCATTAFVEKDDAVNFDKIKTYAWLNEENDDSSVIKKNSLQETSLRQAVNAELEKANWRMDKKRPDVILKHDILVEKRVRENTSPVYSQGYTRRYFNPYTRRFSYVYFPSQFMGYSTDGYEAREGTLTITMLDTKTDKVIWQGWSTNEVNNKNLTRKEIESAVRSIFRKFDVAKR